MRRRISVLLLSSALVTFGLVGLGASPASASCIDTGIPGVPCINPCPPGPWVCTQ